MEDDWSDDAPWTERQGGSVIPLGPFQYFLGCNTSKCYVNIWIILDHDIYPYYNFGCMSCILGIIFFLAT